MFEYDFAFSFAGEDRKIVEKIKNVLISNNYTVFYDNDYKHELIGKDLYAYLRKVYKDRCRFVVCFISDNYIKKVWTTLEMTAIKERLMSTFFASDFLLPILLYDSEIMEDIPSFIGFYKHKSIIDTANLLIDKINNDLTDDNYLNNIDNCIEYISDSVCKTLIQKKYNVKKIEQGVTLDIYSRQFVFKIKSEQDFNLPCILIYYDDAQFPDLFISWKRAYSLKFDVIYSSQIKNTDKDVGIKELISIISNYMIECAEMSYEEI